VEQRPHPGARHITLGQLDKRLSELDKFKDRSRSSSVCATGNRSSSACGQLKKGGFGKVFSLGGGVSVLARCQPSPDHQKSRVRSHAWPKS
jgi:rhodanese-related sulfurtransferase